MSSIIVLVIVLEFIVSIHGADLLCSSYGYHQCNGYDKCCLDGYVCVGSDSCLSTGTIVGIVFAGVIGIVTLSVVIYFCTRKNKRTVGVVFTQPVGGTFVTTAGQQQYGGQSVSYVEQHCYGPAMTGLSQPSGNGVRNVHSPLPPPVYA